MDIEKTIILFDSLFCYHFLIKLDLPPSLIRSDGFDKYEIIFEDGNRTLLSENGSLMRYHKALVDKFREENITVNWK